MQRTGTWGATVLLLLSGCVDAGSGSGEPEMCNNDVDDDLDGAVDCDDPDCAADVDCDATTSTASTAETSTGPTTSTAETTSTGQTTSTETTSADTTSTDTTSTETTSTDTTSTDTTSTDTTSTDTSSSDTTAGQTETGSETSSSGGGMQCGNPAWGGSAACVACVDESCCAEAMACVANPECDALLQCFVDGGNLNACSNRHPRGAMDFGTLDGCMGPTCYGLDNSGLCAPAP